MKKRFKKGQATLESILLLVLLFSLTLFFFNVLKDENQGFLTSMIKAPYHNIRGMARSGVWKKYNTDADLKNHPNVYQHHLMMEGDLVQ